MTLEERKERLAELSAYKPYRRRRSESKEEYATRACSIMHRGWAFLGLGRPWFDQQVADTLSLIS